MKRLVAAVALLMLVSPAIALERSPDNRGHSGNGGRGEQTVSDRSSGLAGRRDGYSGGGERGGRFSEKGALNRSFFQGERNRRERDGRN